MSQKTTRPGNGAPPRESTPVPGLAVQSVLAFYPTGAEPHTARTGQVAARETAS